MITFKEYLMERLATGCKHPTEQLHFYGKRIRDCESCGRFWIKDGLNWRDPTQEEFTDIIEKSDNSLCS